MTRIGYAATAGAIIAVAMVGGGMNTGARAQALDPEPANSDCLIEPRSMVDLGSAEEGIIREIAVQRGDIVAAGDVVAQLEFELASLTVEAARLRAERTAEVQTGRARLEFRQREAARMRELHDRNVVSTQSLDEAEIEQRIAAFALRAAEMDRLEAAANLRRAEESLDRHTIRSPVTGVVVEIPMSLGEFVYEQSPVMRIAEVDPLNVEVFLPITSYPDVMEGMSAEVMPEAPVGGRHRALVTVVDRVFDSASGTFGVRLELPNPDFALPAGLRCTVRFLPEEQVADTADWSTTAVEFAQALAGSDDTLRPAAPAEDTETTVLAAVSGAVDDGLAGSEPVAGGDVIFLVQEQLADAGFEIGRLDGVMGPRTEAAIRLYQSQHGLPPDGRPSRALLDHLRQRLADGQSDDVADADDPDGEGLSISGYEFFRRAVSAADRGDGRLAAFLYSKALDAGDLAPLHQAYAYNNRGSIERARGQFDRAIGDYDSAIGAEPGYVEAYMNRAAVHGDSGRPDLAIQDYDRAIALAPDLAQALHGRGIVRSEQGDLTGAIADFDAAVALSPDLAEVYFDRGRAYLILGKPDLAITDYAKLFEYHPRHAGLRAELERLGVLGCDGASIDDCLSADVTAKTKETP